MKQIRIQIDKIVERLLVLILSVMVINVLWQVFTRFFTSNPSSFTDELARYLMIWLGILNKIRNINSSIMVIRFVGCI